MKINILREYVILTETLSFAETARRLYTTRSTISKHIDSLEQTLGVRLLMRSHHSVRLTKAGTVFASHAKKIILDYDEAIADVRRVQQGVDTVVNVGYLSAAVGAFLPQAINIFSARYPNVELRFTSMEIDHLAQALESDEVDMGITNDYVELPRDRYSRFFLCKDGVRAIVPKNHSLAKCKLLKRCDLRGEDILLPSASFMRNETSKFRNIVAPIIDDIVLHEIANDIHSLLMLMETNKYIALHFNHLITCQELEDKFQFIPIEGCNDNFGIITTWKKSSETTAIIRFSKILSLVIAQQFHP